MDIASHTSGKMRKIVISLSVVLALTACATPEVDQTVSSFNEITFTEDLNNCRGGTFIEASVSSVGTAMLGSLYGAWYGMLNGSLHGESAQGAAIGAALGATVGLGVGALNELKNEEGEIASCLEGKGYLVAQ